MIRQIISVYTLLVLSSSAFAQPEVIADFGGRETEFPKKSKIKLQLLERKALVKNVTLAKVPDHFPVRSALTVGIVEQVRHSHHVARPIFIVGVDSLSIEWLVANKAHLKSIGAQGIVTNVSSQEDMDFLRERALGLTLSAVPVDDIASIYGIHHYPVLIDKEDVKQ
jgi:integrating conjugative element protein (TIGR03765 family)